MRFEYPRATRTAGGHHELKVGARAQREHHFSKSDSGAAVATNCLQARNTNCCSSVHVSFSLEANLSENLDDDNTFCNAFFFVCCALPGAPPMARSS